MRDKYLHLVALVLQLPRHGVDLRFAEHFGKCMESYQPNFNPTYSKMMDIRYARIPHVEETLTSYWSCSMATLATPPSRSWAHKWASLRRKKVDHTKVLKEKCSYSKPHSDYYTF
ncbi:hypothetical protein QQF64_036173 [Cirrhinus molitorella]|uniref:Uncharacterized protein n=1 Tax=Cirrhinus molitorella TaxID=172907 RepID=A0ABR3NIW5_9TELE